MDTATITAISTAIIGTTAPTLAALAAWRSAAGVRKDAAKDRERLAQRIEVMLASPDRTKAAFAITRSELSRAEVLGRLGMLPMREKGARFSLRALSRPSFVDRIDELKAGTGKVLEIQCSVEEMGQFA